MQLSPSSHGTWAPSTLWSGAMDALRGGGCERPGLLSFPAVASPVLLLVALHSACNAEQQPRCCRPTPGQKQSTASQRCPAEGKLLPLCPHLLGFTFSSDCRTSYTDKLNAPAPRCQPLNQGQQEKATVENVNQPELGALGSGAGSPRPGSPSVSSHGPPGAGTCPGSAPCLSSVTRTAGSTAPGALAGPPLPTILHCSPWLCFAVVAPPRRNSRPAQGLWQDQRDQN